MLRFGSFLTSVLFLLGLGFTPVTFAGETPEEIMAEFDEEKMELKEDFKEDLADLKEDFHDDLAELEEELEDELDSF